MYSIKLSDKIDAGPKPLPYARERLVQDFKARQPRIAFLTDVMMRACSLSTITPLHEVLACVPIRCNANFRFFLIFKRSEMFIQL